MKTFDLYSAFVSSDSFKKAIEAIEDQAIREAILLRGIGDSLTESSDGFFYNFEEGNLLEPAVTALLKELEEEKYWTNYNAIATVGLAYEKWANEQKEKPDLSLKA